MEFPYRDVTPTPLTLSPEGKGPGHAWLDAFVGHWSVKGQSPLATVEDDEGITGFETLNWFTGEHFLEYRWDRVLAHGWHHGVGLIGFDLEEDGFVAHFFDNLGLHRHYVVGVEEGRISFSGMYERGEMKLADDGQTMRIHWERADDHGGWKRLVDLNAHRTA